MARDAPSFGWFQSLLQEVEAAQADRRSINQIHEYGGLTISIANFLRINVYLTQKIGEDMLWNIAVNDAGAEYDPLTLLRSRTMFGRPDWMTIYGQMRQAIENGQYLPGSKSQLKTKVGVCHVLGPLFFLLSLNRITVDILLRPCCFGQSHQRGHSPSYGPYRRLFFRKGWLFNSCLEMNHD